jgi:hypothetical protein
VFNKTKIVNNITVENNVVVNRGPDVRLVEKATHRQVRPIPIEKVARAAPQRSFTREQLRVDSPKSTQGLRAAEPVSESTPLPTSAAHNRPVAEKRRNAPATRGAPSDARGEVAAKPLQQSEPLAKGPGAGHGRGEAPVASTAPAQHKAGPRKPTEKGSVAGPGSRNAPAVGSAPAPHKARPKEPIEQGPNAGHGKREETPVTTNAPPPKGGPTATGTSAGKPSGPGAPRRKNTATTPRKEKKGESQGKMNAEGSN